MNGLPLHPALVHVPVGLALVLPLVAAGLAWAIHRKALPRKAWLVVVGLLVLTLGGAMASLRTGEQEEERVESVVAESAIEAHEERAEIFTWVAGLLLAVAVAALVIPSEKASFTLAGVTVAGSVALAVLAMLVGHAGGKILHGHMVQPALQVPADGGAPAGAARGEGGHEERGGHDDDD